MIRNALWRTYDSSYAAAKSLLAWSGLGKRLTRDGHTRLLAGCGAGRNASALFT